MLLINKYPCFSAFSTPKFYMCLSVLTKASALSKQLNKNEATRAALLENLGALQEALKIKEQALSECSKQLWNAMRPFEYIRTKATTVK